MQTSSSRMQTSSSRVVGRKIASLTALIPIVLALVSHTSCMYVRSTCTVRVTKKFPFSVKQRPCKGNFAFRFCARSVVHISVFIFAACAKLFYARGTVKKTVKRTLYVHCT